MFCFKFFNLYIDNFMNRKNIFSKKNPLISKDLFKYIN